MSPEELANFIHFSLDQLSSRNGHHEFEELVRHFVRARIATNVLPATGPVSAGGDKGRDLETFQTYLRSELGPHGQFLARAADDTIVCMCSLQRKGVPKKFRDDLEKIFNGSVYPDRVYAFTVCPIPTGTRYQLIEEASKKYGTSLEIIDSRAISQELSQPDTFWIAQQYLNLASDIAPPWPKEVSWYTDLRDDFRKRSPEITVADFISVKSGIRHATFSDSAKPDLPFWIDLTTRFVDHGDIFDLRRRAKYEICVAMLRGTGSLKPADGFAEDVLNEATASDNITLLEDGCALLSYCIGALARGETDISPNRLAHFNAELLSRITRLLSEDSSPGRRALLHLFKGQLLLQPDPKNIEGYYIAGDSDGVEPHETSAGNNERDASGRKCIDASSLIDLDGGMEAFSQAIDGVDDLPFFPIERLATFLRVLAPLLTKHSLYRKTVDRVDSLFGDRAGKSRAAEFCRDRAIALQEAGNFVEALNELHQAKVNWWSNESIRGSILTMLMIADCLRNIGYLEAATHSALFSARLASDLDTDEVIDLIPIALTAAADLQSYSGNWVRACGTTKLGLLTYSHFVAPINIEDPHVQDVLAQLIRTIQVSRFAVPDLEAPLIDLLESSGLLDYGIEILDEQPNLSLDDWLSSASNQLKGDLLNDCKEEHQFCFNGLGLTWIIRSNNSPTDFKAAARFASACQVLLVELASYDLALIKTRITVDVSTKTTCEERAAPEPSNAGRHWKVFLSPWVEGLSFTELQQEILAVTTVILAEASLLRGEEFYGIIDSCFQRGLFHKTGMGVVYDELLDWVEDSEYSAIALSTSLPKKVENSRVEPAPNEHLPWQDGPGPTYQEAESLDAVRTRYAEVPRLFPNTLKQILSSEETLREIQSLRNEGWLDWQILNAIANAAFNYRMEHEGLTDRMRIPESANAAKAEFIRLRSQPETPDQEAIPLEIFSRANLELNAKFSMLSTLGGFGLSLAQRTPDFEAIKNFLDVRYRLNKDDVDHPHFFGETD